MRSKLFTAILFASSVVVTASVDAQKLNLPTAERVTLPNGIRVVLMEYHRVPTLTVNAMFTGGSASDPDGKAGLTQLMASLMRKGTSTRTAPQLADQVDFLGGSLGAFARADSTGVSLNVLSKDTETGLELFADIIRKPSFPAAELERTRQLTLSGLQSLKEDPEAIAGRVLNQTIYAGHPYGFELTMTSVKSITQEDILACYKHTVVPNRMIIVAVGDFRTSEMIAKLTAKFGDWPQQFETTHNTPAISRSPKKFVIVDKPDATQTQVRFARIAFAKGSRDQFSADVASGILGGGFTSRLIDEVRVNKSLTYGISSAFQSLRFGGEFAISTFTKIETTRGILDTVNGVLKKTADVGFTVAEVRKVKSYLSGLYAIRVQTPEALAGQLGEMAFYGFPLFVDNNFCSVLIIILNNGLIF